MQPINKLFKQIRADFGEYIFAKGDNFRWAPQDKTIFYSSVKNLKDIWSLLHEISHGELGHKTYGLDIELIDHEAQAWAYAKAGLAQRYNLTIDDDYVQDHLDTYREWLHARSTCPECGQNGLQTQNTYSCLNCRCLWQANEAKLCNLRRIRLQDQD